MSGVPQPSERPWCHDCGPGYRLGDEGCRHDDNHTATEGETGVCRTCAQPIWWETGTIGRRERVGWSDRIERGGDSVVCFWSVGYRHVPMGAREAAIYEAGHKAGLVVAEDDARVSSIRHLMKHWRGRAILAEDRMARLTSEPALAAFREAWHEADAEGADGDRVRRGIAAAIKAVS